METITEGPYRSFTEGTAGALTGKEFLAVELDAGADTVKLFSATSGTHAIGVLPYTGKRQPDDTSVSVRLLGKGGTLKVIQSAAIAKGARVKPGAGGKVVAAATAGDRSIGIKLTQGTGAANDVIEILDLVESIPA